MPEARLQDCTDDAVALVRRWVAAAAKVKPDAGAARLASVLRDGSGLAFTLGFVDRVVRPEDPRVAAQHLERLSQDIPEELAWYLRGAVTVGGGFAQVLPWAVVPSARRVLRRMAGHLVVDAVPGRMGPALAKLARPGVRLDLTLLGEAVVGTEGSDRRLRDTMDLLARTDVDRVSLSVRTALPDPSLWSFDDTVRCIVERLLPLYRLAATSPVAKHVTLEPERHGDLDLTVAVFKTLLDRPEFMQLDAGIVLQAYLPESRAALDGLTAWAQGRRGLGGAPVTVRLVKGAHLATERVESALHGWPLATWRTKQETDAAYLRMLDTALAPTRTAAVRIGVASHDLFDLATAWVLAERRGVTDAVDMEMLLGTGAATLDAVRADVGSITLYTPLVSPDAFDTAVGYLAGRLLDHVDRDGAAAVAFSIADPGVLERARARYLATVAAVAAVAAVDVDGAVGSTDAVGSGAADGAVDAVESGPADGAVAAVAVDPVPRTFRTQDRRVPLGPPPVDTGFRNAPDTDPSIAANRIWAAEVLRRVPGSALGRQTSRQARVVDKARLERIVVQTAQAGLNWGRQDPEDRAELLDLAAHALEEHRAELVEVVVAETGKTLPDADTEVSEAVDLARQYADAARSLRRITGATIVPPRITVVVPPWNFPVAIPAGGVLAALAAGSGVVLKPAPEARRSAAVLAEVLWGAGVPRSLLALVDVDEDRLGRDLIAHPAVDRVLLTGSADTARSFRWWRAGLPLHAETSGKNAIVVTPSADLDLAVQDVVRSAFGNAGQKGSAASLVVLVGSVVESERFRRQLLDAVRSIRVGWPDDPAVQMGPLIAAPHGALRTALTELEPGESWLLRPESLDDSGRLWSPGIRLGVVPGSAFHQTEYFGPVLGVMTAETLDDAIAIQNGTDYGLTAGIHSLDVDEVAEWIRRVEAGNLFVNRGITGAVVRRQPFGGWKRSAVGTGTKAGGPMYVATLGRFRPGERERRESVRLHGVPPRVATLIEAARSGLTFEEFDQVRAGALSDVAAKQREYGVRHDPADLGVERNVLRYRPQSVIVRRAEGATTGDLVRVLAAATAARASVLVSSAAPLPGALVQLFASSASPLAVVDHVVESDAEWLRRAASGAVFREQWSTGEVDPEAEMLAVLTPSVEPVSRSVFGGPGARIRLVGGDALALEEAFGASVDVAIHDGPVVDEGLVEMLPFLREQVVSITTHRFGIVDPAFAALRV